MGRKDTKQIKVGNVVIGGQNKVVIQSMCNTKTKDIESTVNQIKKLQEVGCEIVRVACLDIEDAKAIQEIKSKISLIAMMTHLNSKYIEFYKCILE